MQLLKCQHRSEKTHQGYLDFTQNMEYKLLYPEQTLCCFQAQLDATIMILKPLQIMGAGRTIPIHLRPAQVLYASLRVSQKCHLLHSQLGQHKGSCSQYRCLGMLEGGNHPGVRGGAAASSPWQEPELAFRGSAGLLCPPHPAVVAGELPTLPSLTIQRMWADKERKP